LDPDPDGAGEPEDRRRGVSGCPAPEAADPRSCNGAGAGALRADEEEEEEGLGVAGLRWKPMAALTRPATMAGRLEADAVRGCRGRLGLRFGHPSCRALVLVVSLFLSLALAVSLSLLSCPTRLLGWVLKERGGVGHGLRGTVCLRD